MHDYKTFFREATGFPPFPYQEKIASLKELPHFLSAPTGAGKTSAVVLAWLWQYFGHPDPEVRNNTPRRLVYCLPMRTLVEQTYQNCKNILKGLKEARLITENIGVHILMGGEVDEEWLFYPEKTQIIIGTQDMLISRALNRGYAMSRFKWPMAFGLLQNGCQWIFDEVQLMGAGLSTSAQLAAFNRTMSTIIPNKYLWMSATIDRSWFKTVDFSDVVEELSTYELEDEDREVENLNKRLTARKTVRKLEIDETKKNARYYRELSLKIIASMKEGHQVLVIVNRVADAQKIFLALQAEKKKIKEPDFDLLLVHSRFRPAERKQINERIPEKYERRIIVATQAVEAGVDISSRTLFTELCPWPGIVQRLGRCNRFGEYDEARVFWIDIDDKDAAPYSPEELSVSRKLLEELEGRSAAPSGLPQIKTEYSSRYVLRRKDFIELFDTTPDLSGSDIDVSRFIRDTEDIDVHLYWRCWDEGKAPPVDLETFYRDELCAVNIGAVKNFISKIKQGAWRWDYLNGNWLKVKSNDLRPGMTVLLPSIAGGYSPERGWHGGKEGPVEPVIITTANIKADDTAEDQHSFSRSSWQTLAEHTDDVVAELEQIAGALKIEPPLSTLLLSSARWHDAGKAHQVFQETMRSCSHGYNLPQDGTIWAKSPENRRHRQRYFRHELAGALAFLQNRMCSTALSPAEEMLIAYLVTAHHGKVRISVRSLPNEKVPEGLPPDTRISRGVWDGSIVYQADLGGGVTLPETAMDLTITELGLSDETGASWLERMLKLRDEFGLLRLAFLEACLRAADIRASANIKREV